IVFGGRLTDREAAKEVPCAIGGNTIEAALEAAEQMRNQAEEQRRWLDLELEQARYEARLAARRYEAVDPENRLVIGELEIRWNAALQKAGQLETKLQDFDHDFRSVPVPDKEVLLSLAQDLPAFWDLP